MHDIMSGDIHLCLHFYTHMCAYTHACILHTIKGAKILGAISMLDMKPHCVNLRADWKLRKKILVNLSRDHSK